MKVAINTIIAIGLYLILIVLFIFFREGGRGTNTNNGGTMKED